MNKKSRGIGIWLSTFLLLMLMAVLMFSSMRQTPVTEKYSDVLGYFQRQEVKEYTLDLGTGELKMTFQDDTTKDYKVPNVVLFLDDISSDKPDGTKSFVRQYNEAHPDAPMVYDHFPIKQTPWWVSLLPTLVLVGLLVFFYYMMMKQARGGGTGGVMSFGKAKPRAPEEGPKVTFQDVAGADEEKEELVEIVEFLKNPSKFNSLGARIPKGVLLMGPPGTGKTLLAKAVAGEAGVPFFSISGSDFVEMFVGVGASRVRDLFDQAKKNSPCIIFIDEIDAVGRQRGTGLGGGHDEREQTLNQLLVEMDGFGVNEGVIMIAATNRPDILDPALMRPGRFDRQVVVGYPDIKGREAILKVHARKKPLAPDVRLDTVAKSTAGFTGADLENLLNEAALLAARKSKKAITMEEIGEATIKVVVGAEKKTRVMNEKEKKLTAYHEAGHAIAFEVCETQDSVHQISIIPTGMAGGYTMPLPAEDKSYNSLREMEEDIVVAMGGRVAESLIMGDISTGASNDIQQATKTARAMVTKYGMSRILGPIAYGESGNEVFIGRDMGHVKDYSDETAAKIDEEVFRIVTDSYKRCEEILNAHMPQLHAVAKFLIKHEKMDHEQFMAVMNGTYVEEPEEEAPAAFEDSADGEINH